MRMNNLSGTRLYLLTSLLLLTLGSHAVFAQKAIGIHGRVSESADKNQPVPYATVRIYHSGKLFSSSIADQQGVFQFSLPQLTDYTLEIISLGYQINKSDLSGLNVSTQNTINLQIGLIKEDRTLAEVAITARKNLIKQSIDKLSYNVLDDPERKDATTLDILRRVPLISIDMKESIMVNGKSTFKVLINGKPSALLNNDPSAALRNLLANQVSRIEVITEPSSRFTQNGVSEVINIITTEKKFKGFQNSIRTNYSSLAYLSTSLTSEFKQGKWGLSNYISGYHSAPPEIAIDNSQLSASGSLMQKGTDIRKHSSIKDLPELSFELDSLNLFLTSAEFGNQKGTSSNKLMNILEDQQGLSNTTLQTASRYKNSPVAYNFYYQNQGKKNEERLFVLGYRYSSESKNLHDSISSDEREIRNRYLLKNNTRFTEHTLQADYSYPVNQLTVEAGAKGIWRSNRSLGERFSGIPHTSEYIADPVYQDQLANQQRIYTFYNSYYLKKDQWGLKVNLRYEYTHFETNFQGKSFNNLVPQLSYQYKFPKDMFTAGYDQTIERPALWQLNTFTNTSNPNFQVKGNSALNPAVVHNFQAAYQINRTFFAKISVYYEFIKNGINGVLQKMNGDTTLLTYANIGKKDNFGLKFFYDHPINKRLNIGLNSRLNFVDYHNFGNRGWEMFSAANMSYLLKSGYRIDGYFRASSPYIALQGESFWWLDHAVGLNKKFLKNRLNTSVMLNNPLQKFRERNQSTLLNELESYRRSREVIRDFGISLNYRFGKLSAEIRKNEKQIDNNDLSTQPQQ